MNCDIWLDYLRIQLPFRHFSLEAHSRSLWQTGRHMESRQVYPGPHSPSQATGTRTHSFAESPVKPSGQWHCFRWFCITHSAFWPQAWGWRHGLKHWPPWHTSNAPHSVSRTQAAVWMKDDKLITQERSEHLSRLALRSRFVRGV